MCDVMDDIVSICCVAVISSTARFENSPVVLNTVDLCVKKVATTSTLEGEGGVYAKGGLIL